MTKEHNFCVVDIETRGLSARPESFVLGCVYGHNGLTKEYFLSREEMIYYIFNCNFKYIFAHNAEFDFTCLFDNIILNLDNEALFVGSLFIKAKRNRVVFMNSLAILKSSVEALGKASGKEKGILNDKFKTADEHTKIVVTKEDIEYCFRDCEIIYDYLCTVFEHTEKMKPTIASCAMEIFLKKFLKRKFILNRYNEKFRESYYGGRVECFRFGKINPCFKYDVNSIYPFVCTKMYFPDFNKMKKGKPVSVKEFTNFHLKNYEGGALVKVKHEKNFVCVLPFRKETEIIYPYGTWVAWYNFNELRNAIKTGLVKILEVKEFYYAPKIFFNELSDYMKFYFEKKDNSEGAEKLINKFLLNALTGKFAQKEHGRKIYFKNILEANAYLRGKNIKKFNTLHFSEEREDLFLEIFSSKERKNNSRWNIPTISSYITSEARIYMLQYYLKYQDAILYTDTDSIVLSRPMNEPIIGKKLGEFKKEDDEQIEIIGNKHYYSRIGKKRFKYIKGVHKLHTKKNGKFVFKKMIRTKEGLRRLDKLTGSFERVEKQMSNDYTKRIVMRNKTLPLKLSLS